jgi:coenzyme F420-reducing hydrogenase delta subunit
LCGCDVNKGSELLEAGEMSEEFRPKIIAFCCTYCAYSAADLAGSMRLSYSPYVRIVKLPCTGKTDPLFFLRAFQKGADGVFVAGCLEGQCHFIEGNISARKRVSYTKKLLVDVGINPERLEMYNLSAAMGKQFAEICDSMTERIMSLGPLKINETKEKSYVHTPEEGGRT